MDTTKIGQRVAQFTTFLRTLNPNLNGPELQWRVERLVVDGSIHFLKIVKDLFHSIQTDTKSAPKTSIVDIYRS